MMMNVHPKAGMGLKRPSAGPIRQPLVTSSPEKTLQSLLRQLTGASGVGWLALALLLGPGAVVAAAGASQGMSPIFSQAPQVLKRECPGKRRRHTHHKRRKLQRCA